MYALVAKGKYVLHIADDAHHAKTLTELRCRGLNLTIIFCLFFAEQSG